ncbi:hypothetical protein ACFE04_022871 [Oxalis oulophora]
MVVASPLIEAMESATMEAISIVDDDEEVQKWPPAPHIVQYKCEAQNPATLATVQNIRAKYPSIPLLPIINRMVIRDNTHPKYTWLLPGWLVEERTIQSTRKYKLVESGQKQGGMILTVPEGTHVVRFGNDAKINQDLTVVKGSTCAQVESIKCQWWVLPPHRRRSIYRAMVGPIRYWWDERVRSELG